MEEAAFPIFDCGQRIGFQYHRPSVGILEDLPSSCGFKPCLAAVPCLLNSKPVMGSGTYTVLWGRTGKLSKQGCVCCTESTDVCFVLGCLQGRSPVPFTLTAYPGFTITLP